MEKIKYKFQEKKTHFSDIPIKKRREMFQSLLLSDS